VKQIELSQMPTEPEALTLSERALLKWLGDEDFSQYGECRGKDLDAPQVSPHFG
jgi:hypothetical protein